MIKCNIYYLLGVCPIFTTHMRALTDPSRQVIHHSSHTVSISTLYCLNLCLCSPTAAVSFERGYQWFWLPWWKSKQPTGPDEDQMQPSSVPDSSGTSAAKLHSFRFVCLFCHTMTLSALDSFEKTAGFPLFGTAVDIIYTFLSHLSSTYVLVLSGFL